MPISSVPTIAVRMVATIAGWAGMPAAARIAGFTTMMYDMVTNVVIPATASRASVVPARWNPKYLWMAFRGMVSGGTMFILTSHTPNSAARFHNGTITIMGIIVLLRRTNYIAKQRKYETLEQLALEEPWVK